MDWRLSRPNDDSACLVDILLMSQDNNLSTYEYVYRHSESTRRCRYRIIRMIDFLTKRVTTSMQSFSLRFPKKMTLPLSVLIVGATGGLGKCLVQEALSRGHAVSVLVRNKEKLNTEFAQINSVVSSLKNVYVGDAAADGPMVKRACEGKKCCTDWSGLCREYCPHSCRRSKSS